MSTKPRFRFSAEVIDAFKHARDCDDPDQYIEACRAFEAALKRNGLKRGSWEVDIMDADTDNPPDDIAHNGEADPWNARTWAEARKLRVALEEAAR